MRIEDDGKDPDFAKTVTGKLRDALYAGFGAENVIIENTDFVGSRFSKGLGTSAAWLVALTLIMIMLYCMVRFKIQYAIGAVLSVVHDALIMVAFIAWTRMEFNTTTIAAILTIIGYSINDTIVNYDRIREDRRLWPEMPYVQVLNIAITETLSRTIITTLTTLLCVFSLFFFTRGSMQNFALALIVGMVSGTYSTIYIAGAFVDWWNNIKENKHKRKVAAIEEKERLSHVKAAKA
jgi:preprotein translocase subunit SecF